MARARIELAHLANGSGYIIYQDFHVFWQRWTRYRTRVNDPHRTAMRAHAWQAVFGTRVRRGVCGKFATRAPRGRGCSTRSTDRLHGAAAGLGVQSKRVNG
jgi:hypothetical protein